MKLYKKKEDDSIWTLKKTGTFKFEPYVVLELLEGDIQDVTATEVTLSKVLFEIEYTRLLNLSTYKEASEFSDSELIEELRRRNLPISIIENTACIMYTASIIEDTYNRHLEHKLTTINYCLNESEEVVDGYLRKQEVNTRLRKYKVYYEEVEI